MYTEWFRKKVKYFGKCSIGHCEKKKRFIFACVKAHPRTGHEGPEGEYRYSSTHSLTSALDGGGWSTPLPSHFTAGKDLVPQGRSGVLRKISPPPGFDLRTVQPVASRYPGPLWTCVLSRNIYRGTAVWIWRVQFDVPLVSIQREYFRVFIRDIPLSYMNSKRELQPLVTTKYIPVYCLLHFSAFLKSYLKSIILIGRVWINF